MGNFLKKLRVAAILAGGLFLAGCAWIPSSGPSAGTIEDEAVENGQTRYLLVGVNDTVINTLLRRPQPPPTFQSMFGDANVAAVAGKGAPYVGKDGAAAQQTVSIGDSIDISIWDVGGGLFSAMQAGAGTQQVVIPEQVVQSDGTIAIPYVGRISVIGRTQQQLQDRIQQALAKEASNPQVIVTIAKSLFNTVALIGEGMGGSRIPLAPNGDRILDIIATAAGLHAPTYNTYIRLTRNGKNATIPFATLYDDPRENIYLWPGDIITVLNRPQTFLAFGAGGKNGQVTFDQENVSLAMALGDLGGLNDNLANPTGVFLLRYEPMTVAHMLSPKGDFSSVSLNGLFPVVYQFDFNSLNAYFMAQRFAMQDKDVLYVSNSTVANIKKIFSVIGSLTSPIMSTASSVGN